MKGKYSLEQERDESTKTHCPSPSTSTVRSNDDSNGTSEINLNDPSYEQIKGSDTKLGSLKSVGHTMTGSEVEFDSRSSNFTVEWTKLDYVLSSKWYHLSTQRKPILDSLSGSFRSGELTAVLGPSGAGKSTLIDCLLGKRNRGLSGKTRVIFENESVEQERRKSDPLKIATIPQHDHLLESLTVMETFMFASKIKNAHVKYDDVRYTLNKEVNQDPSTKRKPFDHFANAQRVIQQLGLSSCAGVKCGKLSGGQRKRVSIGQELLSQPDILVLDEPTSGLDSVTCFQTVKALRQLADTSPYPMAIVVTIHQPDIEVFNLFHNVYVIATGGRPIYEGATIDIFETIKLGVSTVEAQIQKLSWSKMLNADIQDKLATLKHQIHEQKINPARLLVEIAAGEYGLQMINALNQIQRHSHETKRLQSMNSQLSLISDGSSGKDTQSINIGPVLEKASLPGPPTYDYYANDPRNPEIRKPHLDKLLDMVSANLSSERSFSVHFRHLIHHTHRSWITIVRDPMLFSVQVLLHILVPLLISYAFYGHNRIACPLIGPLDVVEEAYSQTSLLEELNKELRDAFENLGYMFFQMYVIIFAAVCMNSLTYPLVMHVLLKEYRNGWYSLSTYFMGRTLADLPVPTMNVIMAIAISYHLTGQPVSAYGLRFISVAMLTTLATLVAQTQGLMFGALLMNAPQSAVFVAPASTAPLVVVSGFLIRVQSLPYVLQIFSKFSLFTYLINGAIISIYGFQRCPCDPDDFSIEEEHTMPKQTSSLINLWIDTFRQDYQLSNDTSVDLVGKLVDTISRAKTFGHEMQNCDQVKPFAMLDYQLNDSDLVSCFAILTAMLVFFRWLAYVTLTWQLSRSI